MSSLNFFLHNSEINFQSPGEKKAKNFAAKNEIFPTMVVEVEDKSRNNYVVARAENAPTTKWNQLRSAQLFFFVSFEV